MRRTTAALLTAIPIGLLATTTAHGEVIVSGDHTPAYNGTDDPWNVGTPLTIGDTAAGEMEVNTGSVVSNFFAILGKDPAAEGTATVTGAGSEWNTLGELFVGDQGTGTLNVVDGGLVTNTVTAGILGTSSGSRGTATVTGANSRWNSGGELLVGQQGTGELNVQAGGVVTNTNGSIGRLLGSEGTATVTGAGSRWSSSGSLYVGGNSGGLGGQGALNIQSGGRVTVGDASATSTAGALVISDADASGADGGVLNIFAGSTVDVTGVSVIGENNGEYGWATVTGAGSQWNSSGDLLVGLDGEGTLTIEDGGVVTSFSGSLGGGFIPGTTTSGIGTATVTGDGAQWNNTRSLSVGVDASRGTLTIEDGGVVTSARSRIVDGNGSWGMVTVTGAGSVWDSGNLEMGVGSSSTSSFLTIKDGGKVMSTGAILGVQTTAFSDVEVKGVDSWWDNSGELIVGESGAGRLTIKEGGLVTNTTAVIGRSALATIDFDPSTATVTGDGSQWNSSGDLVVGINGTATLNILNQGLVSVLGVTSIGDLSTVNLNGGRFEFGSISAEDYSQINGVSGSLAGQVTEILLTGSNHIDDVGTLPQFSNIAPVVDVSEVVVGGFSNSGLLFGDGSSTASIINNADGTIKVLNTEQMHFEGNGLNNGRYNVFGGQLRFGGDLTNNANIDYADNAFGDGQMIVDGNFSNESTGEILGAGRIEVGGTFTNRGAIKQSGVQTEIHGAFVNDTGGTVLSAGGGTTTFHNDAVHNGAAIETAAGSFTVFLGGYSGAGGFTGDGTVRFEGPVKLGNSPEAVSFGGDVDLEGTATTTFEIAGLSAGEFDQFLIAGDLDIDGTLGVELLDGFELGLDQQFLIADVSGATSGQFIGLGEAALVGSFGGVDLHITYAAGDGNDVALYSVPEPGTLALLGLGGLLALRRRR